MRFIAVVLVADIAVLQHKQEFSFGYMQVGSRRVRTDDLFHALTTCQKSAPRLVVMPIIEQRADGFRTDVFSALVQVRIDICRCGQIGMTEEGRYIQQRNILIDKDAGEGVALSYLTEKNRKGELGFSYEMIRGYNVNNSKIGRSIELDGLAKGIGKAKNRLLVVECKYRTKKLSLSVLEHMKESLSVFPAEFYDIYLFSKSGFADDILALNDPLVHLISVEDMTK